MEDQLFLGILSEGEGDFEDDTINNCFRIKYCTDKGCLGETVIPRTKMEVMSRPTLAPINSKPAWGAQQVRKR